MIRLKMTAAATYKNPVISMPSSGISINKMNRSVPIRNEPMANNVEKEM